MMEPDPLMEYKQRNENKKELLYNYYYSRQEPNSN